MTSPAEPSDLRNRILEAAVRLFAERGYGSTSVREVVEAVGCTKPALYYHFGSKEELYLHAVQTQMARMTEIVAEVVAMEGDVACRLHRFAQALLDRVEKRPYAMRLLLTAEHHPTDEGQPEVDLLSMHLELVQLLTRIIEEGQTNGTLRRDLPAYDLCLSFIGMVNLRALGCLYGMAPGPEVAPLLVDIFINGARPKR